MKKFLLLIFALFPLVFYAQKNQTYDNLHIRDKAVVTHKLGVGVNYPTEAVEVDGAIKIGAATAAQAGTLQWDGSNFTVFDGSIWKGISGNSSLPLVNDSYIGSSFEAIAGDSITAGVLVKFNTEQELVPVTVSTESDAPYFMATETLSEGDVGVFLVDGFMKHAAWAVPEVWSTAWSSVDTVVVATGVTNPTNAYSSNNSYAVLPATGLANKSASYGLTEIQTIIGVGSIVGVEVLIEHKVTDTADCYFFFDYVGEGTATYTALTGTSTSDIKDTVGGPADLLGLNTLLADLIADTVLAVGTTLEELLADTNLTLTFLATDTTHSVDHIAYRYYYTYPMVQEYGAPVYIEYDSAIFTQDPVSDDRANTLIGTAYDDDGIYFSSSAVKFPYWDDLTYPAVQTKQGATDKPLFDLTEVGLKFPYSDSTHLTVYNVQLPHKWVVGTSIYPHVHYIQVGQSDTADFILKYRWINMGDTVTDFIRIEATDCTLLPYTAGTNTHQLAAFPTLDGTGLTRSSILDIKLFRKEDVGYNGTILVKDFDIHFELVDPGSNDQIPD